MSAKYKPRGDYVLLQSRQRGITKEGLVIPDQAGESKEWFVIGYGDKVEDLMVEDKVLVMGVVGQDVVCLPMETDQFITKQANILSIVLED